MMFDIKAPMGQMYNEVEVYVEENIKTDVNLFFYNFEIKTKEMSHRFHRERTFTGHLARVELRKELMIYAIMCVTFMFNGV